MGETTGIAWTAATVNFWWGCTKVGPACDDCYAEATDKRAGGSHWGQGVPRRKIKGAATLLQRLDNRYSEWAADATCSVENARVFKLPVPPLPLIRRPVFISSMSDLFDLEVPVEWFADAWASIAKADRLYIQICTKRVSAIKKRLAAIGASDWPQHAGLLITVVTQTEADRDIPRLLALKKELGIPWVGISYEPAQELVDFWKYLFPLCDRCPPWEVPCRINCENCVALDWIIFGRKSGRNWNDRPFDVEWGRSTLNACQSARVPFFFKQVAAFRPTDDMVPADLMVRQFPKQMRLA